MRPLKQFSRCQMRQCKVFASLTNVKPNVTIRYGALRLISVEQGYDAKDFSLVAFGGAGPLHANVLGRLLGSFPVIIPPSPGVLCALGDATTRLRHEIGRSFIRPFDDTESSEVLAAYDDLLKQIEKVMSQEQGVPKANQVCLRFDYESAFYYLA